MASFGAHRQDDLRTCGAKTVVVGQSSVFVNNKLWAVEGDICDHAAVAKAIPSTCFLIIVFYFLFSVLFDSV